MEQISLAAVITVLTQLIKNKLGISGKKATVLSVVVGAIVGIGFGIVTSLLGGDTITILSVVTALMTGIVIGLAACGIYDLGFKINGTTVTVKDLADKVVEVVKDLTTESAVDMVESEVKDE